jgi:CDP-diacylglycerol pyrophosphatase
MLTGASGKEQQLAVRTTLRRRLASVAVTTGCMLTLGAAPVCAADPQALPPFTACGPDDAHTIIWDDNGKPGHGVKGATPANPQGNLVVVFPTGTADRGYALKNGTQGGGKYNFLLVPTVREYGIECGNLLEKDAPPFFSYAYKYTSSAPTGLPPGTDWALGIESAFQRGDDQMHIHVSRLRTESRNDLDTASKANKCATSEGQWFTSIVTVSTDKGDKNFRCWNAASMDNNFFFKTFDNIVKKLGSSALMAAETLLITQNHTGPGFLVLDSDKGAPDLSGKGVQNIEGLLNKAG